MRACVWFSSVIEIASRYDVKCPLGMPVCVKQDEESEKERMQLVRGQVATILENYYEDTLVAPSGSAMAELVDKTSLKASQV